MKTRFYYTLAETMKQSEDETQFNTINNPAFMYLVMEQGVNVGGLGLLVNTMVDNEVITDTTETKTVMQRYIWNMYYKEKVMYIDVEHEPWEGAIKPLVTSDKFKAARQELGGKIWSWVEESKERYIPLINMYTNNIGNLLNQIKSSSINKFNDTPQNTNTGFEGDNHVSNISQSETTTDGGTLISRLDEIRQNLHSVYGEWAREFSAFTIEE